MLGDQTKGRFRMGMLLSQSRTLDDKMKDAGGVSSGFDYLRILLAVSVIVVHSSITDYGASIDRAIWGGWHRPVIAAILPMFFALSGYLVTGSLLRSESIPEFLALRMMRLLPALFVEVCIAGLILGPIFTALPLHQYFTSPKLYSYAFNIVGYIHYQLPGLFLTDPDPNMVNRQLWTIPVELECYLAITALGLLTITKRRGLFWAIALLVAVALTIHNWRNPDLYKIDNVPLRSLLLSFIFGVGMYLYKDKIPHSRWLFVTAALATCLCLYKRELSFVAALPAAYMTVYLGLLNPSKSILNAAGDYSYGIYLYGYPVQQAYAHLFPGHRVWWLNIIFSLGVAMCFAAFSWNVVEKRVLSHKTRVVQGVRGLIFRLQAAQGNVVKYWVRLLSPST